MSRRKPDDQDPFNLRNIYVCTGKGKASVQDEKFLRKEINLPVQIGMKANAKFMKKTRSRKIVCGYLVPETRKNKGTTGVCWESDIHVVSIRQTYILESKVRS